MHRCNSFYALLLGAAISAGLSGQIITTGGGGGGGTPAGTTGQFQNNNAGSFGGTNGFEFIHNMILNPTPSGSNNGSFLGTGVNDLIRQQMIYPLLYDGPASGYWLITVDSVGGTDTYSWSFNNGTVTSGVAMTVCNSSTSVSHNLNICFMAATGHTLGDKWLFAASSGNVYGRIVFDPQSAITAALAGAGAGNVNNGTHFFTYVYATPEGISYTPGPSNTVTVADKTVNGKVTLSIPAQEVDPVTGVIDPRVIGYYIFATKAAGSTYFQAPVLLPTGTRTYTYNFADASLLTAPVSLDSITTTGPCFIGEESGYAAVGCQLQFYDYGVRIPFTMFLDRFPNGVLATSGGFIKQAEAADFPALNPVTVSNCSSTTSPATCGAAAAGSVAIPTGVTSVALTVNTTAITANSQIFAFADDTLGAKLSVTCNSTLATLVGGLAITARTAGTSFQITYNGTIATNPLCVSFLIVN